MVIIRRMLLLPLRMAKRQYMSQANHLLLCPSTESGAARRHLEYVILAAMATRRNGVVGLKVRERCVTLVDCILPSLYVVERSNIPMRLQAHPFRRLPLPSCGSRRTWKLAHQSWLKLMMNVCVLVRSRLQQGILTTMRSRPNCHSCQTRRMNERWQKLPPTPRPLLIRDRPRRPITNSLYNRHHRFLCRSFLGEYMPSILGAL